MYTFFFILAVLFYGIGTFIQPHHQRTLLGLTFLAWLTHGAALFSQLFIHSGLHLSFALMLSLSLWVSVVLYWIENLNFSLDGLRVFVFPSAALSIVLSFFSPTHPVLLTQTPVLTGHILISILAYGILTIAAFHAALMMIAEDRLHQHRYTQTWITPFFDRLPALLTMEKLLFRFITIGFSLLTLTILSGVIFSKQLLNQPLSWDHKTLFSILSWGFFALLLLGRQYYGWRGKTALRFTLLGFSTLLLAYVGSHFILEIILKRG
jgi:ABC-type uncharacterized transport system permease subunit